MVSDEPTRKIVKELRYAGFVLIRTNGSHAWWEKDGRGVSVPSGHKTISPGVVRQIRAVINGG